MEKHTKRDNKHMWSCDAKLHTAKSVCNTKHICAGQKNNRTYISPPEISFICFSSSIHACLQSKNAQIFDIFLFFFLSLCLFVFTLTEQKRFEQKPEARQSDSDWANRSRDHATAIQSFSKITTGYYYNYCLKNTQVFIFLISYNSDIIFDRYFCTL